MTPKTRFTGLTLAELLVTLLILGQIATFTIPKVLSAQQNGQNKTVSKEVVSMIAGAYQQARLDGIVTASTTMGNITSYMNYVSVDTTSTIDAWPTFPGSTISCADFTCLRLHNGAIFMIDTTSFADGGADYIDAIIDSDGRLSSQKDSIVFMQFQDGRITTFGDYTGDISHDPDWFSW